MDNATIAVILSIAAIVLQIITLVIVFGMRSKLSVSKQEVTPIKPAPQQTAPPASFDRKDRKDNEFRRPERRPHHTNGDRQNRAPQQSSQAPVSPVDPVEKSLRDINLRLKNAERDQESARKKLQEDVLPRESQNRDRGERSDRDYNRNRDGRGERDRGGDRDRGDRDNSRNRGNRYDRSPRDRDRTSNWQDRRPAPGPQAPQSQQNTVAPQGAINGDSPVVEIKEPLISTPVISIVEQTSPVVAAAPVMAAVSETPADQEGSSDDLQHGRKIIVKRRPLKEGQEGGDSDAAAEETVLDAQASVGNTQSPDNAPQEPGAEISFGRRKGK